jgi:hypothetical protein
MTVACGFDRPRVELNAPTAVPMFSTSMGAIIFANL